MKNDENGQGPTKFIIIRDWMLETKLDLKKVMILAVVDGYRATNTKCYVTNEQFGDILRCNSSNVKTHIRELRKLGYLSDTPAIRLGQTKTVRRLWITKPTKIVSTAHIEKLGNLVIDATKMYLTSRWDDNNHPAIWRQAHQLKANDHLEANRGLPINNEWLGLSGEDTLKKLSTDELVKLRKLK